MEKDELCCELALSKIEGVGPVRYKRIIERVGKASEVFKLTTKQMRNSLGLNDSVVKSIKDFKDFDSIEKEIVYSEKNGIRILTLANDHYPSRLKQCIDSPSVLFYKGEADLNAEKIISVIGTRLFTDYGKRICEELIEELKAYGITVVSGLAYGIDAIAHKVCVKSDIPTIGVVAHGLDMMYPSAHLNLSKEIVQSGGGLLSEYFSGTKLDKGNFPTRNRIVAGMSDATLIIETDIKGGSMITSEIAYSYNRDVFCVPGRITDLKSRGCNYLIKSLKGQMITHAEDIANSLGWNKSKKQKPAQKKLFVELTEHESIIIDLLKENEQMHIDEFYAKSVLSSSELAVSILSLEMQNLVIVKPGKLVSLLD